MGLFSRDVCGSLDRMFDLNRDGKLDIGEEAFMFEVMDEEEKEIKRMLRGSFHDFDEEDDEYDDDDY